MTVFLRPVRRGFILIAVIIVLALGLGRFWAGDGGAWVWLTLVFTALFFAYTASNWPALHALDVRPRKWLGQALATVTLWSVVLAAIETVVANIMQRNSPFYAYYDWFLVTHGPAPHLDTDAQPYVLENLGTTAGTVAWTFVFSLLMFLLFAVVGLAVGLSLKRWPQLVSLVLAAVAGLVLLYTVLFYLLRAPDPLLSPMALEEGSGQVGMVLIAAVLPLIAAGWTIRRSLRNPWG